MKININELWAALFFWTPQKIDMYTGRIYSARSCTEESKRVTNAKYLPIFSRMPIYQQYIRMLRDRLGIVDDQGLLEYPELGFVPIWDSLKGTDEYFKKMYVFVDPVSEMLEDDRRSATPKYDTSFPLIHEYVRQFGTQFAKEWCDKEGIEWYED